VGPQNYKLVRIKEEKDHINILSVTEFAGA
jgi:hypothetical protein